MTTTVNAKVKLTADGKEIRKATADAAALNKEVSKTNKAASMGAAELDKMNKGVASFGKNSTSNFAKQAQGLGGLVHVYATVAANVFALSAAFTVLKNNADLTIMKESAEDLSKATGISYSAVANRMNEITAGAISFTDAMRSANLALSGGASFEQVEEITEIANKAANTLGVSVPNAVNRMIQAVTKGEPELVDELGIILRVTRATEEYAAAHNKAAAELTTFEKQQAIINQLITQGNDKFSEVEQRANPYEVLASSVSELTKELISLVSGPLTAIAATFSQSTGLMIGGIGILVSSIIKRAIPEISRMGDIWRDKAAAGVEKATMAVKGYEEQVSQAKKTLTELAKTQRLTADNYGDLAKDLIAEDISQGLNKNTKLGKMFKNLDSKGLVGEAFLRELKSAKIDVELQRILDKGLQNKPLRKFEKKLLDQHSDEIELLLHHVAASNTEVTQSVKVMATNAKVLGAKVTQLKQEASAQFLQGLSNIFSARGGKDTFAAYNASMSAMSVKYNEIIAKQTGYNVLLSRGSLLMKQMGTSLALVGKGFTGLFSLFTRFTIILFVVESIMGLMKQFGLLSKELEKAKESIKNNTAELEKIRKKYSDFGQILLETPKSLTEVTAKWNKLANVTDQYNTVLKELLDSSKALANVGFFDKILNFVTLDDSESKISKGLVQVFKDVQNKVTTSISLPISVDEQTASVIQKSLEDQIFFATTRLAAVNLATGKFNVTDIKQRKELNDLIGVSTTKLEEINRNVLTLDQNTNVDVLGRLFASGKVSQDLIEDIISLVKKATKPFKEFQATTKQVEEAVDGIDTRISKLTNKSESRRILNVDTSIGFRDDLNSILKGLTDIKNASNIIVNGDQGLRDLIISLAEVPESFKKAFLSGEVTKASTYTDVIGILNNSLSILDSNIDSLRNYKKEVGIITEAEKQLKAEQARGDTSTISNSYDLGTKKIQMRVQNIKEQITQQKSLIKLLEERGSDTSFNSAGLRLLKSQLDTEQAILDQRKEIIGVLKEQVADRDNLLAIIKAQVEVDGKNLTLTKDKGKLYKKAYQSGLSIITNLEIEGSRAKSLLQLRIKENQEIIKKMQTQVELDSLEKDLKDNSESLLKIQTKLAEGKLLEVQKLSEELALRKQIIAAQNSATAEVDGGFRNSFNFQAADNFLERFRHGIAEEGRTLGRNIANPIAESVQLFVSASKSFTDNLVDALIEWDWDGKEEGRSMGVAIREALKDDLRNTLGSTIKDNMQQAILTMVGKLDPQLVSIERQISAMDLLTVAVQNNTAAQTFKLKDIDTGGSGISGLISGIAGRSNVSGSTHHFAKGGVVSRPTRAIVGEGGNSEAIIPMPDNKTVPVTISGDTNPNVSITQSFDFRNANGATEARLRQYAQKIKQETIADITNNINRGGQLAKVVGRR